MNKRVICVLLCALILSGCASKTQSEESSHAAEAALNDKAKSELRSLSKTAQTAAYMPKIRSFS